MNLVFSENGEAGRLGCGAQVDLTDGRPRGGAQVTVLRFDRFGDS